jgi:hypothetical protein
MEVIRVPFKDFNVVVNDLSETHENFDCADTEQTRRLLRNFGYQLGYALLDTYAEKEEAKARGKR